MDQSLGVVDVLDVEEDVVGMQSLSNARRRLWCIFTTAVVEVLCFDPQAATSQDVPGGVVFVCGAVVEVAKTEVDVEADPGERDDRVAIEIRVDRVLGRA